MLKDLKELVNGEEQMINNSDSSEVTLNLNGVRINAKVMEGEKITKIFEEDIVR